jgi:hypothetical protein
MVKSINIGTEIYTKELTKHGLILGMTGAGKSTTILSIIEKLYHHEDLPNIQIVFDIKGDLNKLQSFHNNGNIFLYEINKDWDEKNNPGTPLKLALYNIPSDMFCKFLNLEQGQENIFNTLLSIISWGAILNPKELIDYLNAYYDEIEKHININTASFNSLMNKIIGFNIKYKDYFYDRDKEEYVNYLDYLSEIDEMIIKHNDKCVFIINVNSIVDDTMFYQLFTSYIIASIKKSYKNEVNRLKLSLYIDESHLLFKNNDNFMNVYICSFIKMIRSKGVGVWFISQGFKDIPADITDNCNTLIQHKLKVNGGDGKSVDNVARMIALINGGVKSKYSEAIMSLPAGHAFISTTDNETNQLPINVISINKPLCSDSDVVTNGFDYNIVPLLKYSR